MVVSREQKPRRRRKDVGPGEIVEAGLQEFAKNGFAGTRVEDIAQRAGVVKGTVYRYYASKEALFEAALKSRVPGALGTVDQLIKVFPGTTRVTC